MSTSGLNLIERARAFAEQTALAGPEGTLTYRDLLALSAQAASALLNGATDLSEERVAYMAPAGIHYVATQWGIWRAGGMAVPLKLRSPLPEIEYVIDDSKASVVVAHPEFAAVLKPVAEKRSLRFVTTDNLLEAKSAPLPRLGPDRWAMLLYTSGTTSRPKGVVISHGNIESQLRSLVQAWEWVPQDRILLFLPLDHIHGIVNVLTCALWSGATCEVMPVFDAAKVWERIVSGQLSLFMAVPDVYTRLIAAWDAAPADSRLAMSLGCRQMRLMVSGSSALPVPRLERWREIGGHTLLERYGMTEIGMALSNPLEGERRPGYVGMPLPGVTVQLTDDDGLPVTEGQPGEIWVRGPGVFDQYWDRSLATRRSFSEGWFRTGDMAVVEDGYHRILGRLSADIIKSGGEKVSALEVEPVVMRHPAVADCAVVGVADPKWGEAVTAAVVLKPGGKLTLAQLREFARESLSPASVPTRLEVLQSLPRNSMGKVMKPELRRQIEGRPQPR